MGNGIRRLAVVTACTMLAMMVIAVPADAQCVNGQCMQGESVFLPYTSPAVMQGNVGYPVQQSHPVVQYQQARCGPSMACPQPMMMHQCRPAYYQQCRVGPQPHCGPSHCGPSHHGRLNANRWRGLSIGIGWSDRVTAGGYCYRH